MISYFSTPLCNHACPEPDCPPVNLFAPVNSNILCFSSMCFEKQLYSSIPHNCSYFFGFFLKCLFHVEAFESNVESSCDKVKQLVILDVSQPFFEDEVEYDSE